MPRLEATDEVVMAVKVPVAVALNEPGTTAGTTGHATGDGDDSTITMLREGSRGILARLSPLTIERIGCRIAIGVEWLLDRQIIGPSGTANDIGQVALAIGSDDGHTEVMVIIIGLRIYPVGGNF